MRSPTSCSSRLFSSLMVYSDRSACGEFTTSAYVFGMFMAAEGAYVVDAKKLFLSNASPIPVVWSWRIFFTEAG